MTTLNLSKVKNGLKTHVIGSHFLIFDIVDSTNENIKLYLNQPEGLTLIADTQTRGKGRLGRSWYSPKGLGIYLSVLLKPTLAPERLSSITLMAGIALIDALQPLFQDNLPYLKWPNDVLVNGRKLAGILCEYCPGDPNQAGALILGIGLNVNHQVSDFAKPLDQSATSLKIEIGTNVDREPIVRSLIEQLDDQYQAFLNEKPAQLIHKWSKRTNLFGKEVSLTCNGKIYQGKATHLNAKGQLALRTENGEILFFDSGEISRVR